MSRLLPAQYPASCRTSAEACLCVVLSPRLAASRSIQAGGGSVSDSPLASSPSSAPPPVEMSQKEPAEVDGWESICPKALAK
jgi:hypothetical protein